MVEPEGLNTDEVLGLMQDGQRAGNHTCCGPLQNNALWAWSAEAVDFGASMVPGRGRDAGNRRGDMGTGKTFEECI